MQRGWTVGQQLKEASDRLGKVVVRDPDFHRKLALDVTAQLGNQAVSNVVRIGLEAESEDRHATVVDLGSLHQLIDQHGGRELVHLPGGKEHVRIGAPFVDHAEVLAQARTGREAGHGEVATGIIVVGKPPGLVDVRPEGQPAERADDGRSARVRAALICFFFVKNERISDFGMHEITDLLER